MQMENKTYLELLAENDAEARKEFEPNSKDLFIEHNEYEDDVDAHQRKEHDELEDQEAFQKYGGSHQQAAQLGELQPTKATHSTAVEYDKAVKVHVLSIDSRFRTNLIDNPSNFLFRLKTPIKNVASVRLSSLEIPNTWYAFSEIRGNTSFNVTIQSTGKIARVTIPEGNYSLDATLADSLQIQLRKSLLIAFPNYVFVVALDPISSLLSISSTIQFSMDFKSGIFSSRNDNWGLGYNLGFRVKQTGFALKHTGISIPDIVDSNYVFVSLNSDWKVVEHNQPDRSNTAAFAKVIIDVPKNNIVYDNGSNTITKRYVLKQPTNITAFTVSVVDEYEQNVQLMGGSISLSLEITEVLNAALYETLRN